MQLVRSSAEPAYTGLAFDPIGGIVYASDRDGAGNLYRIDPQTAATTLIGSTGIGNGSGLAFVPHLVFEDESN